MLLRWILPLAFTLLLGILIGRLSSGTAAKEHASRSTERNASSSTRPGPDHETGGKPTRARPRNDAPPKSEPERVSIRLKDLRNFLSGRSIQPRGFDRAKHDLAPLFSLLGLTSLEQDAVNLAFEQSEREFHQAEEQNIRLKDADDSRIILDLSPMEKLHPQLIENTRNRILASLDPERAAILDRSIEWKGFYHMPENGEMTLRLYRKHNGLWIVQDGGSYSRESRLDSGKFPPSSESVSAAAAFGAGSTSIGVTDRWSSHLGNLTLRPIDVPDNP